MKALLLSMRGTLRSWGTTSLGDDRWTEMRPTASAVIGLLGACAGIERSNPELTAAWYGSWDVISASATEWSVDGLPRMMPGIRQDFQTAQNSMEMGGGRNEDAVIGRRGYLEDVREAAAVVLRPGAPEAFFSLAMAGLVQPVFTPYLGRRSNPLSEPMLAPQDVLEVPNDGGLETVIDGLLARLIRPGLMEGAVVVHGAELQANEGWLTAWAQKHQAQSGSPLAIMSQRLADVRTSAQRMHSQRTADMLFVDLSRNPMEMPS